ncbi:MAG: VRR-NUC domain-containing protein [Halopseudomonas sp.]|uniref:VRR-NUC domain-containing protein n=1 Tax=Halopseudomonas sp. TaxID=2901191 RepID=UPI0030015140
MPIPDAANFYYLSNFQTVLDWVAARYADLLSESEHAFITRFSTLPQPAQALLVRLVMRKGPHFRCSKLVYAEIGDIPTAAAPLLALGWLRDDQPLQAQELANLLLKRELVKLLPSLAGLPAPGKAELIALLAETQPQALPWQQWQAAPQDRLFSLTVGALCERLRLLFFGNLSQGWAEFVLADLGLFRYEQVGFSAHSRGFHQRQEVDDYLLLQRCREAFDEGQPAKDILAALQAFSSSSPWIEQRCQRLRFRLSQQLEREGNLELALQHYAQTHYPGARQRRIRILEKTGRHSQAYHLATAALQAPESEAELQLVERALRRLSRQLKAPLPHRSTPAAMPEQHLHLPQQVGMAVEHAVARQLSQPEGRVYYVENALLGSLFGLLCWEALFAPLPGAFFHPFHSAPADLYSSDFYTRRRRLFNHCLAQLDNGEYRTCIRQRYRQKQGIQSPFVHWALLHEQLLEDALQCIPAAHLKLWFQRLLQDIKANRAGMPDLIQFWPAEQRYRMIEVKGPGDRLQDNQRRWLDFCARHQMPVEVCYVTWDEAEYA